MRRDVGPGFEDQNPSARVGRQRLEDLLQSVEDITHRQDRTVRLVSGDRVYLVSRQTVTLKK